jgi:hypothetical protein
MGFFKGLRDVQKQSREINKNWDAGASFEQAQAQMAAANQTMADMTASTNASVNAVANGIDATAVVTGVRQQGMVNFQPLMEVDLTVTPDGLPPYPVTVKQAVPQMQLVHAQAGTNLHVKVDPDDPSSVWIDWSRPA